MCAIRKLSCLVVLSLTVSSFFTITCANDQLQVSTTYGRLQGKLMASREGREFTAFVGVPYAAAPTGLLRFMPPKPPQVWEGIRNATEEGSVCVQRTLRGEEDCLYLNVFTHRSNASLPVMVYIHGGGFYLGSNSLDTYGPEYLMDKDIVLVTIQYRLGVFGFLSTEDSAAPGNMGLKDQLRALQWVRDNIRVFGGDPKLVTIFGNSAGSASVHLHMLSSASRDLFSRAISQSGTAFSAFATIGRGTSRRITNQIAEVLNCSITFSKEIIHCLQSKNSKDVQQAYSNLQDSNYEMVKVLFRPVVEEPSEHSFLTLSNLQSTTDKPWMVGVNKNEGLFKIVLKSLNKTTDLIKNEFSKFGPAVMFFEDTISNPEEVAQAVYNFYFRNVSTSTDMITALEQMISDSWFVWPTLKAISHHNGTLYCYLFDHNGEHSYTQVVGGPQGFGVSHMDELRYLFPQTKVFPVSMNSEDTNVSKLLVSLWANFAKGADPNPLPTSIDSQNKEASTLSWTPSTKAAPTILHIQSTKLSKTNNIFKGRMDFWKSLSIPETMV